MCACPYAYSLLLFFALFSEQAIINSLNLTEFGTRQEVRDTYNNQTHKPSSNSPSH